MSAWDETALWQLAFWIEAAANRDPQQPVGEVWDAAIAAARKSGHEWPWPPADARVTR